MGTNGKIEGLAEEMQTLKGQLGLILSCFKTLMSGKKSASSGRTITDRGR